MANFDYFVQTGVDTRTASLDINTKVKLRIVVVSEAPWTESIGDKNVGKDYTSYECPSFWKIAPAGTSNVHNPEGGKGFIQYKTTDTFTMIFCQYVDVAKNQNVLIPESGEKKVSVVIVVIVVNVVNVDC